MQPRLDVPRHHALDGIRGYAAAVVVVFHSLLALDPTILSVVYPVPVYHLSSLRDVAVKIALVAFNGDAAVILFFLLSGCVLIRTIERDFTRYSFGPASLAFIIRRLFRLYPGLLVCLAGMCVIYALWLLILGIPLSQYPYSWMNVFRNFFLIAPEIGGHTWTILIEIAVAPLLLIFGYLFYRIGWIALLMFAVYGYSAQTYTWLAHDYIQMPNYLINFALGCMIPYLPGRVAARIGNNAGGIVLIIAFLGVHLLPIIPNLQSLIGFVFLSLIYHSPSRRLGEFLAGPMSQYLGRISYGVYLWHYILTIMLYSLVAVHAPSLFAYPVAVGLAASVPIMAITVVVADLSERLLEGRGNKLGHRLSNRILSVSAPKACT